LPKAELRAKPSAASLDEYMSLKDNISNANLFKLERYFDLGHSALDKALERAHIDGLSHAATHDDSPRPLSYSPY
jgi:hypothetical protein